MPASEAAVQAAARLYYDRLGYRLGRNNSGALTDKTGRLVRYGLWNESAALNDTLKTPDLVGWKPTLVTPDMVGDVVALFVGLEVKEEGWTPAPPTNQAVYKREQAQRRFLDMVRADGGIGEFVCEVLK